MHFNAVLLCYVILCPSTLVIEYAYFYHTVLLICIYVVILLILLTIINLFIFSTGLDYFLTLRILYMVLLYVKRL